ncbi:MAG: DUF4325 domain-containing protein [Candidatus Peribacteraceae bacterium]|nr:DUF4325 domain-containing protein [Candidatus Peribacteraceae bacterium]
MALSRRLDIGKFIVENIAEHPSDIVSVIVEKFAISRQRAHEYLRREVASGKIMKTGHTRATRYFLSTADEIRFQVDIEPGTAEDKIWTQFVRPKLINYPENVYKICQYGFTEMVNNAIDHSEGSRMYCTIKIKDGEIHLHVMDNGVGIFNKIKKALHLHSLREAILHLSKGKFTTDPTRHSGQGIFFTSRMFDKFGILSSDIYYSFMKNDWLISSERHRESGKGTSVSMTIAISSQKIGKEIMDQYADSDLEIGFHKTVVSVLLSSDDNDPHISRSQAKRLLMGLERFRHVVLDFKDVQAVGQAFVDEIFRVFKNEYPDIKITYIHANPDVEFMIKSGIATE